MIYDIDFRAKRVLIRECTLLNPDSSSELTGVCGVKAAFQVEHYRN